MTSTPTALFPALLKHWRHHNGLSQLDLALAAEVSARHISFLETGRSTPSPEMVVQLGHTLGVSLRHINDMLRAVGHDPVFAESNTIPPEVASAINLLKSHHEPFPMFVVDRHYDMVDHNEGAALLLGFVGMQTDNLNLARLTFDPDGARSFITNFDEVGRELLWRIQRELLADPDDRALNDLFEDVLAMGTVDSSWRKVDLTKLSAPLLPIQVAVDDLRLSFLTTMTAFQAPQNTTIEDLRMEAWFPADEATHEFYKSFA